MTATLTFGPNVDQSLVSSYSRTVLCGVLDAAGCASAFVSSFTRTPEHFAEILHDNCMNHGPESQLAIYLAPGQAVIRVYMASGHLNRADTIAAMTAEIHKQGPQNCSRHCSDPAKMQVFDLTDESLGESADAVCHVEIVSGEKTYFGTAVNDKRVSRVLVENGVRHIEIPQPQASP